MVLNLFLWPTVCYMGHRLRIRAPPPTAHSPLCPAWGQEPIPGCGLGSSWIQTPPCGAGKQQGPECCCVGPGSWEPWLWPGAEYPVQAGSQDPKRGTKNGALPPQKPGGAAALWQIPSSLAPHPLTAQSPLQKPTHRPTLPPLSP